jgi:hypothetical protein
VTEVPPTKVEAAHFGKEPPEPVVEDEAGVAAEAVVAAAAGAVGAVAVVAAGAVAVVEAGAAVTAWSLLILEIRGPILPILEFFVVVWDLASAGMLSS